MTHPTVPSDAAPDGRPIIYVRVSTDAQDTARQERSLPERVALDFPDIAPIVLRENEASRKTSAFKNSLFDRPASAEAVRLIENHTIPAIYADHQDRLSRGKLAEWFRFYALCEERGTQIITLAHGQITYDVGGQILSAVTGVVAREESATKSHRVKDAAADRARSGFWVAHKPPTGLRLVPADDDPRHKVLVPDDGLEDVKRAFRLVADSHSIRHASHATGIAAPTLSEILRNRHYVGELRHNDEWLPAKWPAFIEPALFERVQRTIATNESVRFKHARRQPFGPIARCAACGSLLLAKSAGKRTGLGYYVCKAGHGEGCAYVADELLESHFLAYLGALATLLRNVLSGNDEWRLLHISAEEAEKIERELADASAELDNATRLAVKPGAVGERYAALAEELGAHVERLQAEHRRASRDAATIAAELEALLEALRFDAPDDSPLGTRIVEWWRESSVEEKRTRLATILARLDVANDSLAFTFRFGLAGTIRVPFLGKRDRVEREKRLAVRQLLGKDAPAEHAVGEKNGLGA